LFIALHIFENFKMSRAPSKVPSYQIGSDSSEVPSLQHLAKELKSLKIWQKQESTLKEQESIERNEYFTTLEEELRILNAKPAKVQEELRQSKSRSNSKEAPNTIHNSHTMRKIVRFWTNTTNLLHIEDQKGSVNTKSLEKLGLTFPISMGKKM